METIPLTRTDVPGTHTVMSIDDEATHVIYSLILKFRVKVCIHTQHRRNGTNERTTHTTCFVIISLFNLFLQSKTNNERHKVKLRMNPATGGQMMRTSRQKDEETRIFFHCILTAASQL